MHRIGRRDISYYKKISNSFEDIEKLKLDDLKLIYIYCYERIEKNINQKNNDLSVIERMYYECSFNKDNHNNEWYNFITKRESYNYLKRNEENDELKLSQYQTLKLFEYANNLNEELLSKKEIEDIDINILVNSIFDLNKYDSTKKEFFMKTIIKNIVKFAGIIIDKQFEYNEYENKNDSNDFRYLFIRISRDRENYHVEQDESLIAKLKEIYELGDITLLTFYEFIWFEENYDICYGFLSSLKNNILYKLRMKKHILNIKNEMKAKTEAKYKNEKKYNNKSDNILLKMRKKNEIYFRPKKSNLWKIRIPFKSKKKNNIK